MTVSVSLDNYHYAKDELENTSAIYSEAIEKINIIMNNLDSKVLRYVKNDLSGINNDFNIMKKSAVTSQEELMTAKEAYIAAEAKAKAEAEALTQASNSTIGALTGLAIGGIPGAVIGGLIGKAIGSDFSIADTIANITGAVVSAAPKGISYILNGLGNITNIEAFNVVGNAIDKVGAAVGNFVTSAVSGIGDFLGKAGSFLFDAITHPIETLKKTAASVVNAAASLLEGASELLEGILDAAVILGTAAATVANPILLGDLLVTGLAKVTGQEYNGLTQKIWADGIMPFVGKDLSGMAFDALYSIPLMENIDAAAYGPFKRGGSVYKIGKSVGTVAGTIALAIATGGTSIPFTVSTTSAIFAGMQKMGNAVEKNYNKLEDKQDLGSIFAVNANGVFQGLLEGGTWYLTYGNGLGKVGKAMDAHGMGTSLLKNHGNSWLKFLTDSKTKVMGLKLQSLVKAGVQVGKTYSSWGIDKATIGSSKSFGEVTWDAAVNAGIAIVYDNFTIGGKGLLKKGQDELTKKFSVPKSAESSGHASDLTLEGVQPMSGQNAGVDQAFYDSLKATGGKPDLTRFGSNLMDGFNKTGGTIIKKFETLFVDETGTGLYNYFKKVFGGA